MIIASCASGGYRRGGGGGVRFAFLLSDVVTGLPLFEDHCVSRHTVLDRGVLAAGEPVWTLGFPGRHHCRRTRHAGPRLEPGIPDRGLPPGHILAFVIVSLLPPGRGETEGVLPVTHTGRRGTGLPRRECSRCCRPVGGLHRQRPTSKNRPVCPRRPAHAPPAILCRRYRVDILGFLRQY
jgi:hypothetical protein